MLVCRRSYKYFADPHHIPITSHSRVAGLWLTSYGRVGIPCSIPMTVHSLVKTWPIYEPRWKSGPNNYSRPRKTWSRSYKLDPMKTVSKYLPSGLQWYQHPDPASLCKIKDVQSCILSGRGNIEKALVEVKRHFSRNTLYSRPWGFAF